MTGIITCPVPQAVNSILGGYLPYNFTPPYAYHYYFIISRYFEVIPDLVPGTSIILFRSSFYGGGGFGAAAYTPASLMNAWAGGPRLALFSALRTALYLGSIRATQRDVSSRHLHC